jgi:hypothetical protein
LRQKYVLSQNSAKNELKISEYAVIDKIHDKVASSMLQEGNFFFLCEETYESWIILSAISEGIDTLISILRTDNLFPIEPHINIIAESVMELYASSRDGTVELLFDDVDLISV